MPEGARPIRTRGPSRFKQTDLTRALKAAMRAKFPVAAVRITPEGDIIVIPGTPEPVAASERNPWDDV